MDWENIIKYCSNCYYTVVLMMGTSMLGAAINLKWGNSRISTYTTVYMMASFLQSISAVINEGLEKSIFYLPKLTSITTFLFTAMEILIFWFIFRESFESSKIKKSMHFVFPAFIFYLVTYWIFSKYHPVPPPQILVSENLLILSYCLLYFRELFRLPPTKNLAITVEFWCISGMAIYSACTTPYVLFDGYLYANFKKLSSTLSSINYVCYFILFCTFITATLCSRKLKSSKSLY
jgi:hypothetical protein